MDENEDLDNKKNIEVNEFMNELKPRDIKGSKKNIIIPTDKKNVNKNENDENKDEKQNPDTDENINEEKNNTENK